MDMDWDIDAALHEEKCIFEEEEEQLPYDDDDEYHGVDQCRARPPGDFEINANDGLKESRVDGNDGLFLGKSSGSWNSAEDVEMLELESHDPDENSTRNQSGNKEVETSLNSFNESKFLCIKRRKERLKAKMQSLCKSSNAREIFESAQNSKVWLFSRPSTTIGGDQLITLPNGTKRYLFVDKNRDPYRNETASNDCVSIIPRSHTRNNGTVLDKPINELLDELEKDRADSLRETGKGLGPLERSDKRSCVRKSGPSTKPSGLLVDKYAPKRYIDIVSNERQSRQVLNWMLLWRDYVNSSLTAKATTLIPEAKVLLLSGPPGSGKTTLARVVARQCGFHPTEINASDMRTSMELLLHVKSAMDTSSMFGDKKPNCIILDEFDGIANGGDAQNFAMLIAKMATAKLNGLSEDKSDEKQEESEGQKKRKKSPSLVSITRPVILICNDPFVPVLRPLRQVGLSIRFYSSARHRVLPRLRLICKQEKIKAQPGALETLCDLADNDIRACLHGMQFALNDIFPEDSGHVELTKSTVTAVCSNQRDKGKDLFKAWAVIFNTGRRTQTSSGARSQLTKNANTEALDILDKHASDFDIVVDGVHENFLSLALTNPTLQNCLDTLETLIQTSRLSRQIHSQGRWNLCGYLPFCGIQLRLYCHVGDPNATVKFPRAHRNSKNRSQESKAIISDFHLKSKHTFGISTKAFVTEYASGLLEILNLNVRSLPWNLLNSREKTTLLSIADTMRNFGMTYDRCDDFKKPGYKAFNSGSKTMDKQAHLLDHTSVFRVSPRIDKLATFGKQTPYTRPDAIPEPSWRSCEIIRNRIALGGSHAQADDNIPNSSRSPVASKKVSSTFPSKRKRQRGSKTAEVSKPLDFFGRPVKCALKSSENPEFVQKLQENELQQNSEKPEQLLSQSRSVVFVFKEGLTDAVRRPVFMDEFFS